MDRRTILFGSIGLAIPTASTEPFHRPDSTQMRHALIIANQDYEKNRLPNIRNDALLMDKTLKSIGFTTTVVLDGTRTSMLDGIRRFKTSLSPGSFVLLYYSGHGAQVDGENYLIPTDNGQLDDADAAKDQCIPLGGPNGLLEKLGRSPGQLNLIILDACRDDPFPAATKSQGAKGLAPVARPVSGDYVAMAASPGQTASANPKGKNSLYTQELVHRLTTPGLRLEDVFIETRNAVVAASGGKQVPQEFGTLTSKVYLAGGDSDAPIGSNSPKIKLAPTGIRLELLGVPDGAKVKVDDVLLSGTIYTDEIADKTKDVEVSVSAAGFRPYVGKVTLTRGSASALRVNMVSMTTNPVIVVKPKVANRLTDYPALKGYIESLRSIPAGTFRMGGTKNKREQPVHSVTLSAFRMGATPVTVEIWKEYCAATNRRLNRFAPDTSGTHPVEVTWVEVMGTNGSDSFCAWASQVSGLLLTLPSEAQFEYAARGGREGLEYPWGDVFDRKYVWFGEDFEDESVSVTRSTRIYRNSFGLTDMAGNCSQWCLDYFDDKWYSRREATGSDVVNSISAPMELHKLANGSVLEAPNRCVRGGFSSYSILEEDQYRCAFRWFYPETELFLGCPCFAGFRLVEAGD